MQVQLLHIHMPVEFDISLSSSSLWVFIVMHSKESMTVCSASYKCTLYTLVQSRILLSLVTIRGFVRIERSTWHFYFFPGTSCGGGDCLLGTLNVEHRCESYTTKKKFFLDLQSDSMTNEGRYPFVKVEWILLKKETFHHVYCMYFVWNFFTLFFYRTQCISLVTKTNETSSLSRTFGRICTRHGLSSTISRNSNVSDVCNYRSQVQVPKFGIKLIR